MAQVTVEMRTLDLRNAEAQPVTGPHVKNLQSLLNLFLRGGDPGEDEGMAPLEIDGEAGRLTKKALDAFQFASKLDQDSIVGPVTWRHLIEIKVF